MPASLSVGGKRRSTKRRSTKKRRTQTKRRSSTRSNGRRKRSRGRRTRRGGGSSNNDIAAELNKVIAIAQNAKTEDDYDTMQESYKKIHNYAGASKKKEWKYDLIAPLFKKLVNTIEANEKANPGLMDPEKWRLKKWSSLYELDEIITNGRTQPQALLKSKVEAIYNQYGIPFQYSSTYKW